MDVLLTGTFHSDDWISAHLTPLAASTRCRRVRFVASRRVPPMPKVEPIYAPRLLERCVGSVTARLATFVFVALRDRPPLVGGFHLLVNALVAQAAAAAAGSRSLYVCVGGPTELAGGGAAGENAYFARLGRPDAVVEAQLLRAAAAFDLIVTMGSRAAAYFRSHGARGAVRVIGGAIDPVRFRRGTGAATWDVIFVGRLVEIKRVDRFLRALALVKERVPHVRGVLVGDGPCRDDLEALARGLGLADAVTFAGRQPESSRWLQQARLFVLTSASEGLSLSLMEAMQCGLPAVVPAVGDLEDLVVDGMNGYLVRDGEPHSFARAISDLLLDPDRRARFAVAAEAAARAYHPATVTRAWDDVLAGGGLQAAGRDARAPSLTGV